jgi:hypothetical protein
MSWVIFAFGVFWFLVLFTSLAAHNGSKLFPIALFSLYGISLILLIECEPYLSMLNHCEPDGEAYEPHDLHYRSTLPDNGWDNTLKTPCTIETCPPLEGEFLHWLPRGYTVETHPIISSEGGPWLFIDDEAVTPLPDDYFIHLE